MALDDRKRRFCAAYVANGGNATRAAIKAGYAPSGAAAYSSKLLKMADIQAEIDAVRSKIASAVIRDSIKRGNGSEPPSAPRAIGYRIGPGINGGGPIPPIYGDILDPRSEPPETMSEAERLTREFIVARLLQNLDMCLGETEAPYSNIVTQEAIEATDVEGQTIKVARTTVQTVMVRRHNASGANQALKQLDEQLDKLSADDRARAKTNAPSRPLDVAMADKLRRARETLAPSTTPAKGSMQ